ncbi:hypothetical protein [Yersinia kristensenii]|uniref:hypothetical protein n=1 Tax=Yersinia kristensenii TaxID=28152 RepID=UPI0022FF0F00|nr:hypothetical protein [Yersinia kristensenii]MDA5487877.1 hypothetical protein [Yersinia kristensenii]
MARRTPHASDHDTHHPNAHHHDPQAAIQSEVPDHPQTLQRAIVSPPRLHAKRVSFCSFVQVAAGRASSGLKGVK